MISSVKYFLPLFFCFLFSSCFLKKKKGYAQEDSYQEISDINSHKSPSAIAKEYAGLGKKQKKAYKKQLRRTDRAMRKRNKKKLENIVVKTKTKKTARRPDKSDNKTIDLKK